MEKIKQINIKNRIYFYNEQINLKDFDARLLKVDKTDYNKIDIGYTNCKEIANCDNINNVNSLYLMINEEKIKTDIQFQMMWMKTKKFQKNMKKFGKVLKKKLKRLMVVKKLNMDKT